MASKLNFVKLAVLVFLINGCMAMTGKVDHSINLSNVGKTKIIDVTFSYGELGVRHIDNLGFGGTYVSAYMEVPKVVLVKWRAVENGQRYKSEIQLSTLINSYDIEGETISIELNDKVIGVYFIKKLGNFQKDKVKIFEQSFE